ncbi:hypothetical protein LMG6871_04758 [Ralstonia edaphis]|nr:hypothetical protein LMG6871_04758 [Ralstonia sp. LMG 6871]
MRRIVIEARIPVLEFRPDPPQALLAACVRSHWRATKPGEKD